MENILMNGNPYYVHPMQNYGPALQGLAGQVGEYGKQKKAEERFAKTKSAMEAAYSSGDPDQVARLAIDYPESQQAIQMLYGLTDDKKKREAIDFSRSVLTENDPERISQLYRERIDRLESEGRDPSDTISSYRSWINNPQGERKSLEMIYASQAPKQEWEAYRGGGEKEKPMVVAKGGALVSPTGELLYGGTEQGQAPIPPALLKDLDPDVADKGAAAFQAAGGGKDGMKAFNEAVTIAKEDVKRQDAPKSLASMFPNASEAEMLELRAAVDTAKTVESGMTKASTIRKEQRRLKKAQGFKDRAVTLLDGILKSPDLDDVIGTIEGGWLGSATRLDQEETDLIADIEEAQNILTAENMDLMTGVLSESDIALLKNLSSGALNRKRSSSRFRKDVETLRAKLAGANIQTADDRAAGSKDIQALEWARANSNDPRAVKILQMQGAQ